MICANVSVESCDVDTVVGFVSCVAPCVPSRFEGDEPRRGTMALIDEDRVLRILASGDLSAASCGFNFLVGAAGLSTGEDEALFCAELPSVCLKFLRVGSAMIALVFSVLVLLFHALVITCSEISYCNA